MITFNLSKLPLVMLCLALAQVLCGCETINKRHDLLLAAESNNVKQVNDVLALGVDVNVKDNYGHSPLHVAAAKGNLDVAELLIAQGADVNARDKLDNTPLIVSAHNGYKDVAELLIVKGADVNAVNKHYTTPLHAAADAYEGNKVVAELLISKGAGVNSRDINNDTPLHAAIERGHKDIAELLLAHGADVNSKNINDDTPLHVAADRGYKDIAELLLAKGADVNASNTNYDTPLHVANNNDHKDVAELLLAKGADSKHAALPPAPPDSPVVTANKGFYAYFDLGIIAYTNAPKDSTDGFLLGAGYHFNPYVGVEGGLSIIKDSKSDHSFDLFTSSPNDTLSADSFQLAVVGTLPLDSKYDLFGKLGWANTSLNYSYSYRACGILGCYGPSITGRGSASQTNPMFGIGWQWKPSSERRQKGAAEPLKVRIQYENFGKIKMTTAFSDNSSKAYDIGIEIISVGFVYDF